LKVTEIKKALHYFKFIYIISNKKNNCSTKNDFFSMIIVSQSLLGAEYDFIYQNVLSQF